MFKLKFAHIVLGAIGLAFFNNFKKTFAFFELQPYSTPHVLTGFIVDLTTLLLLLCTWWFYYCASKTKLADRRRRLLFAFFHCPLQMGNRLCFKQDCPFGHYSQHRTTEQPQLRDLPKYLCANHLLNRCFQHVSRISKDHATNVCINGFHLTSPFDDLLNLTVFELHNQQQIDRFITADNDRQCAICLEIVVLKQFRTERLFALLQYCSHVFCAQCLINWANKNYSGNRHRNWFPKKVICPLCMTISRRFIVSCRFTDDPKQKEVLFKK